MQGIPDYICGKIDANNFVGGFCGLNGLCQISNGSSGSGKAVCTCPTSFSPLNPSEYWAGCKPDFPLPSCDNGWEKSKGLVNFKRLTNVDWPFTD